MRTREELAILDTRYQKALRLNHYPVAVKMLKDAKELDELTDVKGRPLRKVSGIRYTFCQAIAQARYMGTVVASDAEGVSMCTAAASFLGFRDLPEDLMTWEYPDGYVRMYFTTEEVARKNLASVPRFPRGTYAAVLLAPLERMPVDPDVVVFFGNSAQIMAVFYGWNYDKGERLDNGFCGMAACLDMIVEPMQTGKPRFIIPCNGGRVLSWKGDDNIAIAIPGALLDDVIEGIEFNRRGMLVYPIPWQDVLWEPPKGTVLRRIMDGEGAYPPDQRHPEKK